jgi:hypothetical protein
MNVTSRQWLFSTAAAAATLMKRSGLQGNDLTARGQVAAVVAEPLPAGEPAAATLARVGAAVGRTVDALPAGYFGVGQQDTIAPARSCVAYRAVDLILYTVAYSTRIRWCRATVSPSRRYPPPARPPAEGRARLI